MTIGCIEIKYVKKNILPNKPGFAWSFSQVTPKRNYCLVRDWSKSIGWGGPEQRGGGLAVFDPLVRPDGSCNFQLPIGSGSFYLLSGIGTHLSANLQLKFHLVQDLVVKYMHHLPCLKGGLDLNLNEI